MNGKKNPQKVALRTAIEKEASPKWQHVDGYLITRSHPEFFFFLNEKGLFYTSLLWEIDNIQRCY